MTFFLQSEITNEISRKFWFKWIFWTVANSHYLARYDSKCKTQIFDQIIKSTSKYMLPQLVDQSHPLAGRFYWNFRDVLSLLSKTYIPSFKFWNLILPPTEVPPPAPWPWRRCWYFYLFQKELEAENWTTIRSYIS